LLKRTGSTCATFNSSVSSLAAFTTAGAIALYFSISDNGTTTTFNYSSDGINFQQLASITSTAQTAIGFFGGSDATYGDIYWYFHWGACGSATGYC
jgi:hypothetical protein